MQLFALRGPLRCPKGGPPKHLQVKGAAPARPALRPLSHNTPYVECLNVFQLQTSSILAACLEVAIAVIDFSGVLGVCDDAHCTSCIRACPDHGVHTGMSHLRACSPCWGPTPELVHAVHAARRSPGQHELVKLVIDMKSPLHEDRTRSRGPTWCRRNAVCTWASGLQAR